MPRYRVTIKRTFAETAEVEVEAEDEGDARDIALDEVGDEAFHDSTLEDEAVESVEEIESGGGED